MQCGPICYEIKERQNLIRKVIIKATNFRLPPELGSQPAIHEVWNHLTEDSERLHLIARDILSLLQENRFILALSERKDHLYNIQQVLTKISGNIYNIFYLTGDAGKRERLQIIEDVNTCITKNMAFCILSTGLLIGEGFDLPELNTLMFTMPISFKGRVIQYAGRIHREHDKKQDVIIYDYLDMSSGLTISMFKNRVKAYKKMGYEIDCRNNKKIKKYI
jgi:superfamily II DNA or RNA helicase